MASPLLAFITPVGSNDGVNGVSISGGQADNAIYCAVNDFGTTFSVANKELNGVFISSRFGALYTQKALYINGAAITVNPTQPSGALPTLSITMLAENRGPVSRFFPGTVHMTALGASMAGKEGPFTTAWNKYKTKWLAHPYDRVLSYAALMGYAAPSAPQQAKQRTLIDSLITAGIWSKLDVFYNFYTNGSSDFAKINWKNPGSHQAVGTGHEPTFTTNAGFKGNGTSMYLDTTFNPARAAQYKLVDASLVTDLLLPVDRVALSATKGNAIAYLQPYYALNTSYFAINGNSAYSTINTPGDAVGLWYAHTDGNYAISFKNGAPFGTPQYSPATVIPDATFFLLADNQSGTPGLFTQNRMSMFGAGASLVGKEAALYNAWIAYKSAAAYSEILEFATASLVPLPSAQQQEAGQLLIYDLMLMGVWEKLDVFYNFFTDAPIFFAGINWKNPYASTLGIFGGISFANNVGISGDGATGYVSLGIVPGTGTEKLTQNNAGVFLDVTGVTPGTKALFGALDPGIGSVVFYPSIGGMSVGRVADDTDITWTAPNPADGFWLLERNAAEEVQAYLNYDLRVDSNLSASALPGFELYLLAANNAAVAQDFSDATISVFALGGSLKQFESRLYQAWETYKARAV